MAVMLLVFPPVGIFLLWKFHPGASNVVKISLSIVFGLLFLAGLAAANSEPNTSSQSATQEETNEKNEAEHKNKLTVIDFSSMDKPSIEVWCNENNVVCSVSNEYSDTIPEGSFIQQSVPANTTIAEGNKINISFSLGKKPPIEYTNALEKAETYSTRLHMSKAHIYDQLVSEYGEQFTADAAQYAIDNMTADWNANALEQAKKYQNRMNMSKARIYDQLVSEYGGQFTPEEAQYAIDHLDE